MAKNSAEARANLLRAVKRIGGLRKTSFIVDISETALRSWIKAGDLNRAQAAHVFRLARAAGESSIEPFIVVDDD
jgi:hypothetical protein